MHDLDVQLDLVNHQIEDLEIENAVFEEVDAKNSISNIPASYAAAIPEMLRQIRLSLIMAIAYRDTSLLELARWQVHYVALSAELNGFPETRVLAMRLEQIMAELDDLRVDAADFLNDASIKLIEEAQSLCSEIMHYVTVVKAH